MECLEPKILCKCRGCGKGCCLTEKEFNLYMKKRMESKIITYPKCGRKVKAIIDKDSIFTFL